MAGRAARRETKMNRILYGMLGDLDAEWEAERRGNKSIDIEVRLRGNLRVAIECEKYGQNKDAEAVKDAASRLAPIRMVDVALAVVYPKGCDTVSDVTPDTMLDYTIVTMEAVKEYRGDHRRHANDCTWYRVKAGGLADAIQNLPQDLGDPDQLAADLKSRLHNGAGRLGASQRESLARSIGLDANKGQAAARRALLVVASAALFHARLGDRLHGMRPPGHAGPWSPMTIGECIDQPNTVAALRGTWRMILIVDYKPIFETALGVLNATTSPAFTEAVRDLAEWASEAAGRIGGLRHDLLGRIFHAMLDTAKHDGSFYTSVPAAILLAGLAIRDRSDVPADMRDMRIMDPACGTGTLLMAAAERVEDILDREYDPTAMIEDVLSGIDVNVTALHMAATTLGLLSPGTEFSRMDIRRAPFGLLDKPVRGGSAARKRMAGIAAAGSLEMYDIGGLDAHYNWTGRGADNIESGERRSSHSYRHSADLVIMNPPFTVKDKRHDQLGPKAEKLVKAREREIFQGASVKPGGNNSGLLFIMLAERLASESGAVAAVLPLTGAGNSVTLPLRKFLAERFHIDTIVTSHDPRRFWFSENTAISEMLVILRRSNEQTNKRTNEQTNKRTNEQTNKRPLHTRIINLAVNPGTAIEATNLAREIRTGSDSPNFQTIWWPRHMVEKGDWSGVQFYSPYLVDRFVEIRDGRMFKAVQLGEIADVGPNGRTITMYMKRSDTPGRRGWASIYGNETGRIKSMSMSPYTYVRPKPNKVKEAERFWSRRATLLLPERMRLNLVRVSAINSTQPTVGTSWTGVRPRVDESWPTERRRAWAEAWPKAMAMYLNSTPGIVALLGVRIPKTLQYPTYSLVENQRRIPVPDLSYEQASSLAATFARISDKTLGQWRDHMNPTRIALDGTVCNVLKLNKEDVARMRFELSREPMVTGKRYGEQPSMDDYA